MLNWIPDIATMPEAITGMDNKLRILNLEDNAYDAELIQARLHEDGIQCEVVRVDTKEEYVHALEEGMFDLILGDYSLPEFDGLSALELAVEKSPGTPFLFVSGVIGEDLAIEALKKGATDYVLKNRLRRLGPAVRRAILEATERAERRKAEHELLKAHADLERRVEIRTAELSRLTASLQDEITDRKRAEEKLIESKELSDALNKINETIHSTFDYDEIMQRAVHESGAILKADAITISLLQDGSFVVKYGYNIPEEFIGAHISAERFKSSHYAVSGRDIIVFNDAYNDDRLSQEDIRKFGIRSLLAAPLISRGDVLGVINFYSAFPFYFNDDYVDFARKLSASLSLALANARLYNDRMLIEEEMRHMAHHDALTDLPNRRLFIDIIRIESAQARRHRTSMALLFMDLDRFKEINDTLGHEVGDMLLKEVTTRLKATVRESDTVARTGGDEFNIILADITKAEVIGDITRKIIESFRKPFLLAGHELHMTTSIGISVYPDDSEDMDTLFRYADIAMYYAKELGRNNFQFYNTAINVRSLERMLMESWLRQSVERNELSVDYQPQVNISTRRIVCAEALVRWRHPERGLLEPASFIPIAEETGFITAIDKWVLRTVCTQFKSWIDAGLPPLCLTVNLSARQFQSPEFVSNITKVLEETGMPPAYLDLEITETTAMSDVERSVARLKELTKMGIHISIDDFGTGYSSLNYLKRLPIERLKIDKSFVRDITTDADDRTIVQTVTAMAHSMKMKVVAEGVETEEQLEFLSKTGCDEMQGFLFSEPLPADKLRELVDKR